MTALKLASVPFAVWLDRAIIAAVVLACLVAMSINLADPDLWGHVQYGRDALHDGLPSTTTYSYRAQDFLWINHEIFAEFGLAIVNDKFGGTGLLVMKALLGLVVILLVGRQAQKQGAGLVAGCALMLLVAAALGRHWMLRPQLVSYVSFALLLALLNWCFEGWAGTWQVRRPWKTETSSPEQDEPHYNSRRMRYLWLVPVLMVVWTNSHGGFLAGLCVYIAYLGLRGVEAFCQRGRESFGLLRRFALMIVAATTATFVNPYGYRFHEWLYHDLHVPRPEILEWRRPDLFDPHTLPFLLIAAVWLATLCFSRKPKDFTQHAILALIGWQAVEHHRHMAFFAIAAGFWLGGPLQSLLERLGTRSADVSFSTTLNQRSRMVYAIGLIAAILICSVQCGRRLILQVDRSTFPVAAVDYAAQQGLQGRMVVTFNWAQYALAALGAREPGQPGIRIHVDGRCRTSYSQAMLDEHFDFILGPPDASMRHRDPASGPYDPSRALSHGMPDLVLLSRAQQPSVEVLQQQGNAWVLLYQDSLAQIWGRATRYDNPTRPDFIAPAKRSIGNDKDKQTGYANWPAIPDYRPLTAPLTTNRIVAQR
jgi:hypothetical protein